MQAESTQVQEIDPEFELSPEDAQFFLSQTGITDLEELKSHIFLIKEEAMKTNPYPCIRCFLFLRLRTAKHPAYKLLVEGMKSDKTALFLDAGCCFGTDIRKAIADGCPAENIIGLDLHQEFWGLGHKLFRSNPDKMASTFIAGSILDPSFVLEDSPEKQNLAPFKGKFKFIHASNFFHLFQEEDQKKTAEHLAALLSPTPGSMIFGSHVSLPEKGLRPTRMLDPDKMFCHSASSWTDLWKTIIPGDGIKVDAKVIEEPKIVPESRINETYRLMWSITRL